MSRTRQNKPHQKYFRKLRSKGYCLQVGIKPLDDIGKPKGFSFEEVGVRAYASHKWLWTHKFKSTHQAIRHFVRKVRAEERVMKRYDNKRARQKNKQIIRETLAKI